MFTVKVPATSANMGPAFDTAGIALQLYNEIEVFAGSEKAFKGPLYIESVNCIDPRIEAGQNIPTDQNNLIYTTICWFASLKGKNVPPVWFRQTDRIPLARGLGSSAACIVAGLLIGNELLQTGCSTEELLRLAVSLEGHPDNVAPAFLGGMVVGASDGDRFEHVKIPVSEQLSFISLIPDFPLSTSDARDVLPRAYTKEQAVFNCSRVALMVAAMMSGNFESLSVAMQDEIHQPYRKILIPGMEYLIRQSIEFGCYGGYLSGAGPTVMLVSPRGTDLVQKMQATAAELKNNWLVSEVLIDSDGASVCYAE